MLRNILAVLILSQGSAMAAENYITGCNPQGLGCAVDKKAELPGTEKPFIAHYKLTYRFTCGATLQPYRSTLFAYASNSIDQASKGWFDYLGQGVVEVDGVGPIKFGDLKPSDLGETYMNPSCGLYIDSVEITASKEQLSAWNVRRADLMSSLNLVKDLYNKRPQLLFWQSLYSQKPEQFRPVIEKRIAALREAFKTDPTVEPDLLQWEAILSDAPDAKLQEAFAKIRELGLTVITNARNLVDAKISAGLERDKELAEAATATETLVK